MKKTINFIVEFLINIWNALFTKRNIISEPVPARVVKHLSDGTPVVTSPLPQLAPDQIGGIVYGGPVFFPHKTKHKGWWRERYLGRKRSNHYFNKNK